MVRSECSKPITEIAGGSREILGLLPDRLIITSLNLFYSFNILIDTIYISLHMFYSGVIEMFQFALNRMAR